MSARKTPTPYQSFVRAAFSEHAEINAMSDVVRLAPAIVAGESLPSRYLATLTGVEHFVRREDGSVDVSDDVVRAEIVFPEDYLRSTDAHLGFRVVRITTPLFHPNRASARAASAAGAPAEVVSATSGIVCLGAGFRPGTRLRAIVFQLYRIASGKDFATDSPLDAEASRYFRDNVDRVRSLSAPALWKQRVSQRVGSAAAASARSEVSS